MGALIIALFLGWRVIRGQEVFLSDFKYNLNKKKVSGLLLCWIIIGCLLMLDNSISYGCVSGFESVLGSDNLVLSLISFVLIFIVFVSETQRIQIIAAAVELVFWSVKLIMYKGGYAVGFVGAPDSTILFYDIIAILIRLILLTQLLKLFETNLLKLAIVGLILIGIKSFLFPDPLSLCYQETKYDNGADKIRIELIGEWNGSVDVSGEHKESQIRIDSNAILFTKVKGIEGEYLFKLNHPEVGFLKSVSSHENISIYIRKFEEDSLIFTTNYLQNDYEFKLKKKSNNNERNSRRDRIQE